MHINTAELRPLFRTWVDGGEMSPFLVKLISRLAMSACRKLKYGGDWFDIEQDVFVDVCRWRGRIKSGTDLGDWLVTICEKRVLYRMRGDRNRRKLVRPVGDLHPVLAKDVRMRLYSQREESPMIWPWWYGDAWDGHCRPF